MGWDGTGWGMGWGALGAWLFLVLLVVGLTLLVVALVRLVSGPGRRSGDGGPGRTGAGAERPTDRARQILDERFARGEIHAVEYAERLRVLRDGR